MNKLRAVGLGLLIAFLLVCSYYVWTVFAARRATPGIFAELRAGGRLELSDFPTGWLDELLAVEDPNFYGHDGIDLATPGGGITTIPQGMVKYLYFDRFKPGVAKIRQSLIAVFAVNALIPKDEQLTVFVNTVWLGVHDGKPVSGFAAGAEAYFGKSFVNLTHDEYLGLVAMIIGPASFSVEKEPERNRERVRRIKALLAGECRPSGLMDVYYDDCGE